MSETYKITNAEDLVRAEYERLYPGEHPSDEQIDRAVRAVSDAISATIGNQMCGADADVEVRMHRLGLTGVFVRAPRELIEELGLSEMLDRVHFDLAMELDARMHEYRERAQTGTAPADRRHAAANSEAVTTSAT